MTHVTHWDPGVFSCRSFTVNANVNGSEGERRTIEVASGDVGWLDLGDCKAS
jgi:hypothetical protein